MLAGYGALKIQQCKWCSGKVNKIDDGQIKQLKFMN